jgi:hypothetical protein
MGSHNRRALTPDQQEKWIKIFREYEPKTHSTMYALHSLAQHWVENEALIEQAAKKEVEKTLQKLSPEDYEVYELEAEIKVARMTHDDVMIPIHRYSSIVMLYTTVERELKRLVSNLGNGKVKYAKNKSYLEQVAKFVEDFHNLRLVECPQYKALDDLRIIRNCIIHCHGDSRLLGEKELDLVRLEGSRPGFYAHSPYGIWMNPGCIRQFLIETWSFFTWVFGKLNWKINNCFQGNKLEQTFKELK